MHCMNSSIIMRRYSIIPMKAIRVVIVTADKGMEEESCPVAAERRLSAPVSSATPAEPSLRRRDMPRDNICLPLGEAEGKRLGGAGCAARLRVSQPAVTATLLGTIWKMERHAALGLKNTNKQGMLADRDRAAAERDSLPLISGSPAYRKRLGVATVYDFNCSEKLGEMWPAIKWLSTRHAESHFLSMTYISKDYASVKYAKAEGSGEGAGQVLREPPWDTKQALLPADARLRGREKLALQMLSIRHRVELIYFAAGMGYDSSTPCSAKFSLLCVIGIRPTSLTIHHVEVDGCQKISDFAKIKSRCNCKFIFASANDIHVDMVMVCAGKSLGSKLPPSTFHITYHGTARGIDLVAEGEVDQCVGAQVCVRGVKLSNRCPHGGVLRHGDLHLTVLEDGTVVIDIGNGDLEDGGAGLGRVATILYLYLHHKGVLLLAIQVLLNDKLRPLVPFRSLYDV
ncbi:hypothetical protein EYF80_007840 [Liparis tanakae]|uniref:Uncharacterized protein n=1 Tax=Liparis tanakae TaxID=230148 RepID=A0A4Z2IXB4_9TELE|nr:hypothetical protein EYF80_007840 [Liparis tanakae]